MAPISYSRSTGHRRLWGQWNTHPADDVSTRLHEDVHQMFGRVARKHGEAARAKLAANMVFTLPQDVKAAAQDFAHWKSPSYRGNHEETIANVISYLNNPKERQSYRNEKFQFHGNQPYRPSGDFPGSHRHPRYATDAQQARGWRPDEGRQQLHRKYKHEQPEHDRALQHDQHMKAAHRHFQKVSQTMGPDWLKDTKF